MTKRATYSPAEIEVIKSKPMLAPREVALLAGIGLAHLYDRWHAGTGPASIKIGRSRRVQRCDFDKWIGGLRRK